MLWCFCYNSQDILPEDKRRWKPRLLIYMAQPDPHSQELQFLQETENRGEKNPNPLFIHQSSTEFYTRSCQEPDSAFLVLIRLLTSFSALYHLFRPHQPSLSDMHRCVHRKHSTHTWDTGTKQERCLLSGSLNFGQLVPLHSRPGLVLYTQPFLPSLLSNTLLAGFVSFLHCLHFIAMLFSAAFQRAWSLSFHRPLFQVLFCSPRPLPSQSTSLPLKASPGGFSWAQSSGLASSAEI